MAAGYRVRINRYQANVVTVDAGRRLLTTVVAEVKEGARVILLQGPYTTGKLVLGLESRITYGPFEANARVGISGRRFPYAASVEGGASRHFIPLTPKPPGKWLVFYWRKVGHVVFRKQVNHPGQLGKAYLRIPLLIVATRHRMKVVTYDF